VRKPDGKIQLGRPRRKCDDNIKMDLQRNMMAEARERD
jgi:hypothetical protein